MFGRRQEEAARRRRSARALFDELAKRPDTVCPFLGMAERADRVPRRRSATQHRCYAFGDPAELSAEQQTEGLPAARLRQLSALPAGRARHPHRGARGAAPSPGRAARAATATRRTWRRPSGGGRRGLLAVLLVLLLAAAGGVGAFLALNGGNGGGYSHARRPPRTPSRSPTPTSSGVGHRHARPAGEPTATPVPTPVVLPSRGRRSRRCPRPAQMTSRPASPSSARRREYPVVRLDDDGTMIGDGDRRASISVSAAPVARIEVGRRHLLADAAGRLLGPRLQPSAVRGFVIYETFQTADGEARFRRLTRGRALRPRHAAPRPALGRGSRPGAHRTARDCGRRLPRVPGRSSRPTSIRRKRLDGWMSAL